MISIAVKTTPTAVLKPSTSKSSFSSRNVSKFMEARLQAELSRCTYSEQGLLPLMRPVLGAVCQRLIVVSYCRPGSAHSQAEWAICRKRSRAGTVRTTEPSVRAVRFQSRPSSTASMKASVTRTELLAFWYWVEWLSAPSRSMSKPASRRTRALRSSIALHQMKSSTSGWSESRMTILAARRVLPPDLMVPADASAPRMKLTGPEAVPPPFRCSFLARMRERFTPAPEPPLKMIPSSTYQLRMESIVSSTDRMKHADPCCGTPWTPMLNHTGELNAAFWLTTRCFSSWLKICASSSSTKYPSFVPQAVSVSATRSATWRSDHSRSSVPRVPRKYFCAKILVAFKLHDSGTSTPSCSKATVPSRKFVMRASRRSHRTSS